MSMSSMVEFILVLICCTVFCQPTCTDAFQCSSSESFASRDIRFKHHNIRRRTRLYSSLPPLEPQEQTYDVISPSHPLAALIQATAAACEPRRLDTTADRHEAFRYEWGTWCDEVKLDAIMGILGGVRLRDGWEIVVGNEGSSMADESIVARDGGRRIRVAGGKYWDIILHMLPKTA